MITQTRDLRTGVSYWQTGDEPVVPTSRLIADIETDVLVIGAGITGSVIAEFLSERHRVVVVDRRDPAKGSTVASTALVEYEIDTPLTHLSRAIRPGAGHARVAAVAPAPCSRDSATRRWPARTSSRC
jgi:glycine/D-amino acid oxidase-like deaminating enzyme